MRRLTGLYRRHGAWTPASLGSALKLWLESGAPQFFTDTAGATPVTTTGDLIARRTDQSANANHLTQATSGSRPSYLSTGPAAKYTGSAALRAGSPVTLSGAFTLYAVGTRTGSTAWVPFGYSGADNAWLVYSDGNVYVIGGAASSPPFTGASGLILARWRRAAGGTIFFAATGMAEVSMGGGAGTLTIDTEGERPAASQFTANANDHRAALVVAADTVTAGTDAAVVAYLKTLAGVTWP